MKRIGLILSVICLLISIIEINYYAICGWVASIMLHLQLALLTQKSKQ